jgi:hypothetical protein
LNKITYHGEHFWAPILLIMLFMFFGRIALNGIEHSKYIKAFKTKCEMVGGVMYIPRGVKGWAMPECRDPAYVIKIHVEH